MHMIWAAVPHLRHICDTPSATHMDVATRAGACFITSCFIMRKAACPLDACLAAPPPLQMGAMQLLGGDGPGLLELHEGLPLVDQLLGRARALEQQHEQQQQQQRQQSGRAAAGSSPEAAEAAKARAAAAEFLSGVASRQQPLDEFA